VKPFEVRAVVNLGGPLRHEELEPLLEAGLGSVWLRAHDADEAAIRSATHWSDLLRERGTPCIRSLALWRPGCGDGLHLRGGELAPAGATVRSVSAHSPAELAQAEGYPEASALVSPIFAPTSKTSGLPPLGLEGLRALALGSRVPCVALGGIDAHRLDGCEAAGAAGAAILGALLTEASREALVTWLQQRAGAVRLPSLQQSCRLGP
jgi:thiamine-phosphate pyrophosphorylase